MTWQKPTAVIGGISAAILAAFAAYNGGAIGFGAAEGTSIDWIKTSLAGLGSIGAMIISAVATWKSQGSVSPTRVAQVAALTTLAASCMAKGDPEGVRLVGQLAEYFNNRGKPIDPNLPKPTNTSFDIGGLLKQLEQTIRDNIAKTVVNLNQEVPKP